MILAATGHRPDKLGGYSIEVEGRLLRLAVEAVKRLKPDEIISGMAVGWDTAVAEASILLNIPFIAAVPFSGQELRWPTAAQGVYRRFLQEAKRVEIISPGGYEPWKMHARNRWMVDRAKHILALWDGGKDGGTAGCIAYANLKRVPVTNVWGEWVMP